MKHLQRPAFVCSTAIAILASCAAPESRPALPLIVEQTPSHVDGGLGKQTLLYVSNGNDEVTVYNYATQKLVGVLTNFTEPKGECSDSNGNVYITDYTAQQIVEYAHGGTKPLEKFDDAPDSPYSCAIDPTTGNLAVANDDGTSQGNIAIWSPGTSQRKTYSDSDVGAFVNCTYDTNGSLLASGRAGSRNATLFAWLPKNGAKLINVDVPGPTSGWTWDGVGGIQWDGKNFALAYGESIYRVLLAHGQVYYVGSTSMDDAGGGQFGFYSVKPGSQASVVIGRSGSGAIDYWSYPTGGEPTVEITHGVDDPFGVVVSVATKK